MSKPKLKKHDRYQLEIKTNYELLSGQRRCSYELDLYCFIPRSLGINRDSYPKRQFYADLQSYIRLTTPEIGLGRVTSGGDCPMEKLRRIVEKTGQQGSGKPPDDYERHVKLFCSIVKCAARDHVVYIKTTNDSEDRRRLVREFIRCFREISNGYRALRPLIQQPDIDERALDVYHFGDEYLSLLIEDYIYKLTEVMDIKAELKNDEDENPLVLVEEEVRYRKRRGYPSIADEDSDNEALLFRRGVLKKFMASILFLYTQKKREGVLLEQTLFGLAAAAAMVFATAVAFLSQSVYGNLSLPFFFAIVVSYIFKDRIKDLLRIYFSTKATRRLFDHKIRIRDVTRMAVGTLREGVDFIAESRIPRDVHQMRNRDLETEIEGGWMGEQVLLYRKRIRLNAKAVQNVFPDFDIQGVTDIMRFSIEEFLGKMDDPKKELFIMDDEGFQRTTGTRVYHLDLVVRFSSSADRFQNKYRVVMSRKGIKRIESVDVGVNPGRDRHS